MTASKATRAAALGREHWPATLRLAMQEVFALMLACPLEVPQQPPPAATLDMTAMVGLAGQLCGVLAVRCSDRSARRMAARMLGIDGEQTGPEVCDVVGEICNMVAGNFKNKIPGLGDGCMLSVPTVITGADYHLHCMIDEEIHTVLLFDGEPLVLSLEIHG